MSMDAIRPEQWNSMLSIASAMPARDWYDLVSYTLWLICQGLAPASVRAAATRNV